MPDMPPNKERSREKYRRHAQVYDRTVGRARLAGRIRRETVERLELKSGDTVLDLGCGTGLSFPLFERRIGSDGRIIGIDLSPDMLAKARERVAREGWDNVTLIESAIEDAEIPGQADAALLHFVHDTMRTPDAIGNVIRHLKSGARVAAAGAKWAPWWRLPVNLAVWRISRPYITTFEGFDRPWSHLERYVPDLQVRETAFGAVYIAWGRIRD